MVKRDIDVLVIVLAGGEGQRLKPLTNSRSKPAVPIGGKYRLIDIPLSNAYHSRFRKILVLTQGKARSLHRHIKNTWTSDEKSESFINLLTPQELGSVYAGDADAVRQVVEDIEYHNPDYVLILPGDHLLKMQYYDFIRFLADRDGDVAISIISRPLHMAGIFGSLSVGSNSKITSFKEKDPDTPFRTGNDSFYASMGIYGFKTDALLKSLEYEGNLFGRDIIPQLLKEMTVLGYDYSDNNKINETILTEVDGRIVEKKVKESSDSCYWRDVGTIDEYFKANMDLVSITPKLNLYGKEWPFFSIDNHLGPAKVINPNQRGCVESVIISEGSFLSDVIGKDLVISPSVYIEKSELNQVICFSNCRIRNCKIQHTIIDKNVELEDSEIGFDEETDRNNGIYIDKSSGVRVVQKKYCRKRKLKP
jgi:glucose-1-phosphate adenylyltransferase